MPFRYRNRRRRRFYGNRRYGRRYRRRMYKPWRRPRRFRASIRRQILRKPKNFLPPTRRVRMRYVDHFSLNPPAGGITSLYWTLNGLWDPYPPVGGHQPMGFDQITELYTTYSVIRTTYQVQMTSTPNVPALWAVYLSTDTTAPPNNWSTFQEQKGSICRVVTTGDTEERSRQITGSVSLKKWLNLDWTEADRQGDSSQNPQRQVFAHVMLGPADGQSDLSVTYFKIVIDYDVLWSDLVKQPQST